MNSGSICGISFGLGGEVGQGGGSGLLLPLCDCFPSVPALSSPWGWELLKCDALVSGPAEVPGGDMWELPEMAAPQLSMGISEPSWPCGHPWGPRDRAWLDEMWQVGL